MRKIIAALRISLDGFIQGPNGEADWVDTWADPFELIHQVDTCILGGGMYPGYERYWSAFLANPEGVSPVTGKVPTKGELDFTRFAVETPHLVVSRTMNEVAWKNTHIVRDIDEIRALKQQAGKDIYAVGGAALISSLMNLGLIDELRLLVHPIVLGQGKALFKDVKERQALKLLAVKPVESGKVLLTYSA